MDLDEVGHHAESLPDVKRKGTEARPGWYVRDRLVARLHDPQTLVIRAPLDEREALLDLHPGTFGVRPDGGAPPGRGLPRPALRSHLARAPDLDRIHDAALLEDCSVDCSVDVSTSTVCAAAATSPASSAGSSRCRRCRRARGGRDLPAVGHAGGG